MGDNRIEIARAVVSAYPRQPDFSLAMGELVTVEVNPSKRVHLLAQVGLKSTMQRHVNQLRGNGQFDEARGVVQSLNMLFGNSAKKK